MNLGDGSRKETGQQGNCTFRSVGGRQGVLCSRKTKQCAFSPRPRDGLWQKIIPLYLGHFFHKVVLYLVAMPG